MSSTAPGTGRLHRLVALLATLLLVPLTAVLVAAPAHADPVTAQVQGTVTDLAGDSVEGATVTALSSPGGVEVTSGETDADGVFALDLDEGAYTIHATAGAYDQATYGDDTPSVVTVDADGVVSVDGTALDDEGANDLGALSLTGGQTATVGGVVSAAEGGTLDDVRVTATSTDDDTAEPVSATTAGGGHYSLELTAGGYQVSFAHTGRATTWLGGSTPTDVTVHRDGSVSLSDDATCTTNCDVAMTATAVTTTYPVSGQAVDPNGDGINAITVTATATGGGALTASTATAHDDGLDADGVYHLALRAGTYTLKFTGTGYPQTFYQDPTAATPTTATITIAPDSGAITVGTTAMPDGLDEVTLYGTATHALGGRALKADASPLKGVKVTATAEDDAIAPMSATSGDDGTFSLSLSVGRYTLEYSDADPAAPVYRSTHWDGTADGGETATVITVATSGQISTPDGDLTGLGDLTMTAAEATTTYPVTARVVDPNGEGLNGITVTATATGGGALTASTATAHDDGLDADGVYHLALRAGTYTLKFTRTGYPETYYLDPDVETPTHATITVAGGTGAITVGTTAMPDGLDDVTLYGTATYNLVGRVLKAPGVPLAKVKVTAIPADDAMTAVVATSAVTTGTFTLALRVGQYTLTYEDDDPTAPLYRSTRWDGTADGGDIATVITVATGGQISTPAGNLTTLGDLTMAESASTDTYEIVANVEDPNGDGINGITATATPTTTGSGGAVTATATTSHDEDLDADGVYHLALRAGTYNLKFTGTGYPATSYLDPEAETPVPARITVAAGSGAITVGATAMPDGLDPVVLYGTATRAVGGRVVSSAGPLSGVTVKATPADTEMHPVTAQSGSDGHFTLALKVGTYKVEYVGGKFGGTTYDGTFYGGSETPADVNVPTVGNVLGGDVDLGDPATLDDVELTESTGVYHLRGTVSDENGNPLQGATVRVYKAGNAQPVTTATTDVDGLYDAVVTVASSAQYWMRFEAPGKEPTWLTDFDSGARVAVTVALGKGVTVPGNDMTDGLIDDVSLLRSAAPFAAKPKLSGKPVVGQVLTTTFGTLTGARIDKDYVTVEWFINGKPADDYSEGDYFEKFRVPAIAATKKVSYRITVDDPDGLRASSIFTSNPVAVGKAPSTVKATAKKGKLLVKVTVPGLPRPTGTVTVKEGKKKIGVLKLTAKAKGAATLVLKKLKKGKHTLTLTYSGAATVLGAKGVAKIKL